MKKNITALAARNNGLWCDAVCGALKHARRNAVHSPALHLAAGEHRILAHGGLSRLRN
jgi:hypothetical protein